MVKEQVSFMKKYRELIQIDGDFYRLRNPFKGNETAWMVVSRDKTRAVAAFYQRLNKVNGSWERLRLAGLAPDKLYEVTCDMAPSHSISEATLAMYGIQADADNTWRICMHGSTLMNAGIPISRETLTLKGGDFASLLYEIREVEA